jgi:hypothetical protein
MGLYDTIYLKFKCPYCGEISEMDFQTKDGDYCMNEFKIGDVFQKGQFRRIDAIGSCDSFTCQLESAKESVWTSGYYGGFSRSFDVYIYCDSKGRITNKFKIYQLNMHKGIMHGKLGELPSKNNYQWKGHWRGKGKNREWISKKVKLTTNGWLDKFEDDKTRYSYDTGKPYYEAIMYLFNLPDGEEAFKLWFMLHYRFTKIVSYLKEELKLKTNEEFASVFLSNKPEEIYKISELYSEDGNKL